MPPSIRFLFSLVVLLITCGLPLAAQADCVTTRSGATVCSPAETRCVADRYGDMLLRAGEPEPAMAHYRRALDIHKARLPAGSP